MTLQTEVWQSLLAPDTFSASPAGITGNTIPNLKVFALRPYLCNDTAGSKEDLETIQMGFREVVAGEHAIDPIKALDVQVAAKTGVGLQTIWIMRASALPSTLSNAALELGMIL